MEALKKYDYLPHCSYEDYKQREGEWELIEGIAYAMAPAPVKKHQKLVGYIFSQLIKEECPECEVLIGSDWKLNSENILKPVPSKKVWVNLHLNFIKPMINQREVQLSRKQIDNNLIVLKSLAVSSFRLCSLNY